MTTRSNGQSGRDVSGLTISGLIVQAVLGFCVGLVTTIALVATNSLSLGDLMRAQGSLSGALLLAFAMGSTFAIAAAATHVFMRAEQ